MATAWAEACAIRVHLNLDFESKFMKECMSGVLDLQWTRKEVCALQGLHLLKYIREENSDWVATFG